MIDDDSPKYFGFQAIITMYHEIACINNFSCGGYGYIGSGFQKAIHSLAHYFDISFDKFAEYVVRQECVKSTAKAVRGIIYLYD